MKTFHILVVKESREGEKRVSLVPEDIENLSKTHTIFVESGAGKGINATDQHYIDAGAHIRATKSFSELFEGIDLIVRVKRANHKRELEEFDAYPNGVIVVGALDPFEQDSSHIALFKKHKVLAISIDQLKLEFDNPMNILAAMSTITGRLAFLDALKKHPTGQIQNILILGYGSVAKSALNEALEQNKQCFVLVTKEEKKRELEALGAHAIVINKNEPIEQTRQTLLPYTKKADIVIAAARASMQKAPILIDQVMQESMKKNCIIVDLALSEGGNIEGSKHDATIATKRGVIITNISAYPKKEPVIASKKWSLASRHAIQALSENLHSLDSALIK